MRYCLRDSAPSNGPLAISGISSCACERRGKRSAGAAAASPNRERLVIDMATSVIVYFSAVKDDRGMDRRTQRVPRPVLQDFFGPAFEDLLDLGHELIG